MTTQNRKQREFEADAHAAVETLYSRVRATIESTPASPVGPRHPMPIAMVVVSGVTASVVMIASGLVYGRQGVGLEVAPGSVAHLVLVMLLLIAATLIATAVSLAQGRRGLGAGVMTLVVTALSVAPTYAALVVLEPVHAGTPVPISVPISPWGIRCIVIATTVATLVLAVFAVALRHSVPVASRLRGAAIGAAAGAWAGLGVFVFCPDSGIPHLLIGHVLPIVVFTLLGLFGLPRLLRP
jgi:hypothetical protein